MLLILRCFTGMEKPVKSEWFPVKKESVHFWELTSLKRRFTRRLLRCLQETAFDCLNETKNSSGEEFGYSRIMDAFQNAPEGPPQEMKESIMSEFYGFTQKENNLNDDLTMILVKRSSSLFWWGRGECRFLLQMFIRTIKNPVPVFIRRHNMLAWNGLSAIIGKL